jgi:hypothetical protein
VFQGKLVPLDKIPLEVQQRLVTQIMDSKSPELAQLKKGLDRTVRVHVDKVRFLSCLIICFFLIFSL